MNQDQNNFNMQEGNGIINNPPLPNNQDLNNNYLQQTQTNQNLYNYQNNQQSTMSSNNLENKINLEGMPLKNQFENNESVKKRKPVIIFIIIGIIILIIIVILLMFLSNKNKYKGKMSEYVVDIVDGVPIPRGFVASSVQGENKRKSGLVIYEGTDSVTNNNVEEARRTRNQFVWIPVDNFKNFVRKAYKVTTNDNLTYDQMITNKLTTETYTYGEIELDSSNMPIDNENSKYLTKETIEEAKRMYESVKTYGGFYIARYEAGTLFNSKIESENDVYFQLAKYPISYAYWDRESSKNNVGALELSRDIYLDSDENYGVSSTLVYGVQWDTTIEWMKSTAKIDLSDSTKYGNYANSTLNNFNANSKCNFSYFDYNLVVNNHDNTMKTLSSDSQKKEADVWVLTTGASKNTMVNNIYDMAGNIPEYTMEYSFDGSDFVRTIRGGTYYDNGKYNSITTRYGANYQSGFRIALYIKY